MKRMLGLLIVIALACGLFVGAFAEVYTDKETVKAAQQALNDAGFDCGTPDGAAGKKTKAAVTAYQEANGLEQTGEIDDALLVSLGLLEQPDVSEILGTWYFNSVVYTESGETVDPGEYGYDVSMEFRENGEMHINSNLYDEGGFDCKWKLEGAKIVEYSEDAENPFSEIYLLNNGNLEWQDESHASIHVYGREKTSSEPYKPAASVEATWKDFNKTCWYSFMGGMNNSYSKNETIAVQIVGSDLLLYYMDDIYQVWIGGYVQMTYHMKLVDGALSYEQRENDYHEQAAIKMQLLEDGNAMLTVLTLDDRTLCFVMKPGTPASIQEEDESEYSNWEEEHKDFAENYPPDIYDGVWYATSSTTDEYENLKPLEPEATFAIEINEADEYLRLYSDTTLTGDCEEYLLMMSRGNWMQFGNSFFTDDHRPGLTYESIEISAYDSEGTTLVMDVMEGDNSTKFMLSKEKP